MKLSTISNPEFFNSLETLANAKIPAKAAYNLKKTLEQLRSERIRLEEFRRELVFKHSKKDEEGNPVKDPNGNISVESENLEGFQKEYLDLLSTDFEVRQIPIDTLGNELKISAKDLMMLDGVLLGDDSLPN